jgi:hypothetical protein
MQRGSRGGVRYGVRNPFTGSTHLGGSEGNQAFPGLYNAHDPRDLDIQRPFSNIYNRMDPRDLATPSLEMDPRDLTAQTPFLAIYNEMDPRDTTTSHPFQSMYYSRGGGGDQVANMGAFAQRKQRALRARGYVTRSAAGIRPISRPGLRPIKTHRRPSPEPTRKHVVVRRKVVKRRKI